MTISSSLEFIELLSPVVSNSVVLDASNWADGFEVSIRAVVSNRIESVIISSLVHTVSSDDPFYTDTALIIPKFFVDLTVYNDGAGMCAPAGGGGGGGGVGGGGGGGGVWVAQPTHAVTLTSTLFLSDGGSGAEVTLGNSLLQFTSSDWDTPKQVLLTAVEDSVDRCALFSCCCLCLLGDV